MRAVAGLSFRVYHALLNLRAGVCISMRGVGGLFSYLPCIIEFARGGPHLYARRCWIFIFITHYGICEWESCVNSDDESDGNEELWLNEATLIPEGGKGE